MLFLLVLCAAVQAQDKTTPVKVTFHVIPDNVLVYQRTLLSFSKLEVKQGRAVLEFPGSLAQNAQPLRVRFAVPLWGGGHYPDWETLDPEQADIFDADGFGHDLYYDDVKRGGRFPVQGNESLVLPLPFLVRLQAYSLAYRQWVFLALGSLALVLTFMARRYMRRSGPAAELVPPGPLSPAAGDYQLLQKIGEGGMGEVWAASTGDQLRCALKFIRTDLAADPDLRARLERELEVCLPLRHPNLLHYHGYGVASDGRTFIISELLEGQTLKGLIASGEFDPPQLASTVVDQIGDALCYLHEQGLVHRDVKPDNIFVCRDGQLKLMDMGLLRDELLTVAGRAHLTRTGEVLGTPAYMPPEQLGIGDRITPAADQYALGIILFEILAGQRPFPQTEMVVLAYHHAHVPPPRPSELNPRLEPEVEEAILRLLSKEPGDRFPDLRAAQEKLASLRYTRWNDEGEETCRRPGLSE